MTTFPGSPRLLRSGIVLIDPETAAVQRIIALQYNPKTLSRSLEVQSVQAEGADRSKALRLTGPAVGTITLNHVAKSKSGTNADTRLIWLVEQE